MHRIWKSSCLVLFALALSLGAAQAKQVDWTALNPAFAGASFVNDPGVCLGCHENVAAAYDKTTHARTFKFGAKGELRARDCESCHGPRSKHVEEPDAALALGTLSAVQQSAVCLQCHQGGHQLYWQSGRHQAAGVSCLACHTVMEKKSDKALLSAAREDAVCYGCHTNVRAQMQKPYHHPVREGRISCADCHNPHGTSNRGMLRGATVNETCYSCHQDKRGPFLWEHAPVRENCLTCHEPHGSNNRDLLNAKGPAQCVTCHQYGGHINQFRYNRVSTPYGNGCVNCHVTVHGSNHPSGAKFNR